MKLAIKKRLKELGAFQFWPVQFGLGTFVIDCIGCYRGLFFGIEAKAPGLKPTKMQEYTMEQIRAAGGLTFTIDNVEAARALFSDYTSFYPNSPGAVRKGRTLAGRQND